MRRHSDTLRGANATTKTRFTGRKQNKRSEFCCLPVVPRKWGLTGEKTHERASCEVRLLSSRLNLSSCLNFVPALPERVARRENGLCLLSLRQNKNSSFPGHAPGKDTLRAANAATERGLTGENARANVVSGRALSPVKIKIPVATADMRRHSDTLRAANAAMKERFTGRKRVKRKRLPVVFPSSIYLAIIVFTSNAPNSSSFPVSPMMFSSISATYSLRPASEGCSFRVQRLALPPLS